MKKILLVHGIFMRPLVMSSLAKRLRKEGYEVEIFAYPFYPKKEHLTDVFLQKIFDYKPEVIVGHSLGAISLLINFLKSMSM